MNNKRDDGGPAFPLNAANSNKADTAQGMSLRDWFAGQATQFDIEEYLPQTQGELGDWCKAHGDADASQVRPWAKYQYADAMLEARKK